jgi:hypothetical protein
MTTKNNVFTIFFHGTNYDRNTNPEELISQLSTTITGTEAEIIQTAEPSEENPLPYKLNTSNPTYLICEGPGSDDAPGVRNPLLNTAKDQTATEINPGLTPKDDGFQNDFIGNTHKNWRITGTIIGSGWNDNVYKAVWLLTHLKWETKQPIDTINLIGWSRGAVSCLKTAFKLFEVFEDTINVNIFAVDPVPGGANETTDDIHFIPPNVRQYVGILALDEDRKPFKTMDRTTIRLLAPRSQYGLNGNPDSLNPEHNKPEVHFLPFPGNHSDLVNAAQSCPEAIDSATIIKHLAWKFLTTHGSAFHTSFEQDNEILKQTYTRLFANRDTISNKISGNWFFKFLKRLNPFKGEREVATHREQYVQDPQCCLNEHHRLMKLGSNYTTTEITPKAFAAEDWVSWQDHQITNQQNEWKGGKTLDLPGQMDIRTMGLT